jgi:hypothetical protein
LAAILSADRNADDDPDIYCYAASQSATDYAHKNTAAFADN